MRAVFLLCAWAGVACNSSGSAAKPGTGGGPAAGPGGAAGGAGGSGAISGAGGGASAAAGAGGIASQVTGSGGAAGGGNAGGTGGRVSGAGGAASTGDLSGGVDWDPWPDVDPVPANTCAVTEFVGGDRSSAPARVLHETWQYDATTRVLTRNHGPIGGSPTWVGYARFDAQGRREMICSAQDYFTCLEWTRDAFGNAKGYSYYGVDQGPLDARALDPAHPPTKTAPGNGGGESETHRLTYDGAGLISTGTYFYPQQGATLSFTRDGEGRCSDVVWTIGSASLVEVDHWTFANGKLASRVVTNRDDPTDVRAVMTYGYDADGALATTVVDGRLDFPDASNAPNPLRDGVADYVVRTVKQTDGSRWVEILDFELGNSSNNARVNRNGTLTGAFRLRWYLSPACEALSLPRHTSQDCEFERPLASMPLGWHNPLVTPIQLWTMTPMPE
jgi:hypothetical protein